MITAGIDIGSLSADTVILKDNDILSYSIVPTGANSARTARRSMDAALDGTGLTQNDIEYIVATGYGRIVVPFSQKNVTEISCHARGANWYFPAVRTVLDMGGQDCKAIRLDGNGKVTHFIMNDKCAAGAGRSMEVMADLLDTPLENLGGLSLQTVKGAAKVSSTCVIFAKSEVMGLLRHGEHRNDILAGCCEALAQRVCALLNRMGVEEELAISGGIAKNVGVVTRVEQRLRVKARISPEPQIVGALGAALFARDLLAKSQRMKVASSS